MGLLGLLTGQTRSHECPIIQGAVKDFKMLNRMKEILGFNG